jgi:hypothetical protein
MSNVSRYMDRRSFLKAIGAAAMAQFLGCRGDDSPAPTKYSAHHDPFTASLEKEIRRMDHWVGDWLIQDYTIKDPSGQIGLVFLVTAEDRMGFLEADMLYHRGTDEIMIPLRKDKPADPKNVPHELWHSLYDQHDEKGLIHQPGYRGPSLEEIADFAGRKVDDPAFLKLQEGLKKSQLEAEVRMFSKYITSTLDYIECIDEMVRHTDDLISGYSEFLVYLPKTTREILSSGRIAKQYDELLQSIADFMIWKEKAIDARDPDAVIDIHTLEELNDGIRNHYQRIQESREGLDSIVEMYRGIDDDFRTAVDARFDLVEKEIKRRISDPGYSDDHEKLRRALVSVNQDREQNQTRLSMSSAMNYGTDSKLASLELKDSIDQAVLYYNQKELGKILGEPDEVMARVVQSLYCLHYGDVEQNLFPLQEQDLAFLERFEYKGRKMFSKGVERYRLGLEMISDGLSVDHVREQLGYATSYTYRGRQYSWPEADFQVKGEIPARESRKQVGAGS